MKSIMPPGNKDLWPCSLWEAHSENCPFPLNVNTGFDGNAPNNYFGLSLKGLRSLKGKLFSAICFAFVLCVLGVPLAGSFQAVQGVCPIPSIHMAACGNPRVKIKEAVSGAQEKRRVSALYLRVCIILIFSQCEILA